MLFAAKCKQWIPFSSVCVWWLLLLCLLPSLVNLLLFLSYCCLNQIEKNYVRAHTQTRTCTVLSSALLSKSHPQCPTHNVPLLSIYSLESQNLIKIKYSISLNSEKTTKQTFCLARLHQHENVLFRLFLLSFHIRARRCLCTKVNKKNTLKWLVIRRAWINHLMQKTIALLCCAEEEDAYKTNDTRNNP